MEKALSYQDVYLVPRYSELRSRTEADISVYFLGRKFRLPVCPSNMESVIDEKTAYWLSENDYFYIYHRFGETHDHPLNFVRKANKENWKTISISVGVKQSDRDLIRSIRWEQHRVDFITIDVAHGDSILVKEMIQFIKSLDFKSALGNYGVTPFLGTGRLNPTYPEPSSYQPKIIVGNVATPKALKNLTEWGADAAKVGIAGGAACSTKHQTGFHVPMFGCVKNCFNKKIEECESGNLKYSRFQYSKIPIIADGGIRENGDISKALVAGATIVMAGSLFAACVDAPGESLYSYKEDFCSTVGGPHKIVKDKVIFKKYHGSSSAKQKGHNSFIEGKEIEIPCNGLTIEQKYNELSESLKSAVSYAGGKNLDAFKNVGYISIK